MRTPTNRRSRDVHRLSGFTLIEVLLAAVILGLAVASAQAVFTSASARAAYAQESLSARQLAREIHKMARTLPRETVEAKFVTSASDVVALGSLHGASFSPPIMADGTVLTELSDWRQRVRLEIVTLADPGTHEIADPHDALSVDTPCLYRLKVTILQGDVVVDTFSWWLRL